MDAPLYQGNRLPVKLFIYLSQFDILLRFHMTVQTHRNICNILYTSAINNHNYTMIKMAKL